MKLTELKGIGEKTEELFSKLGISDVEDLLMFFPRDYEMFFPPSCISEIGYKTSATIKGAFVQNMRERKVNKLKISSTVFRDEIGGSIAVTWFNSPFMKNALDKSAMYVLKGRVSRKYNIPEISQPKVYRLDEYQALIGSMQPIYPLTKGLSNNLVTKAVRSALGTGAFFNISLEPALPLSVEEKFGLLDRASAIKNLHFPENDDLFKKALTRMSFEEIFKFIYLTKSNGTVEKNDSEYPVKHSEKTEQFINELPFKLTESQKKVFKELSDDMASGKVMNRLLEGDVGSGKTIVAILCLMDACFNGYQGALMAPTEVLAEQHYNTICNFFKEHDIKLNAALLTGSMSKLEKQVVYDALSDGRANIVVGTHALIQEKVKYKNLALVITDEQHRFGTNQRKALKEKGKEPHSIVMSATPIPRTLGLIIYGNMDISIIDSKPENRLRIKNAVVDDSFHENAYRFIEKQVRCGHQAYIICPLVEYTEGMEAQNVADYAEMLKGIMPPDIKIGQLTGPMPPEKKNKIMTDFKNKEIDILVSTTVVEVGVDVPNASVMMIEDANRFGLAALHQLRGRVGRGEHQSYCIFVSDDKSKEAIQRLNILNESNDGFKIASQDFKMRGPGELFGTKQSGALSFKNFDISRDEQIAKDALSAVNGLLDGSLSFTAYEKNYYDSLIKKLQGGILL